MSARSLCVHPDYIEIVRNALLRNCFPTQKHLAEELGYHRTTISKFLNGKRVDNLYFEEICRRLELDWREIADFENARDNTSRVEDIADSFSDETESDFSSYMERPPIEERCFQMLSQPGSLLRIKTPKQMGKTSLMMRMISDAKNNGYKTVFLNLLLADRSILQDLDRFLRWFCVVVSRQLQLSSDLAEYWDEELSSNYNCNSYFEEYLLTQINAPIVLALDEVDRIFPHGEIAEDFFSLLRAWHESAKHYEKWRKIRLIISYSTEVYITLEINRSPFNVGEKIELPEFNALQVQEFARQQGVEWNSDEIERIMNTIGGNPSLLQMAISRLKRQEMTFERLLQTAATEAGIYGDRLRTHLGNLQQNPDLATAMKQITSHRSVRLDPNVANQLHRLGLVKLEGNEWRVACELYRQYFADRL